MLNEWQALSDSISWSNCVACPQLNDTFTSSDGQRKATWQQSDANAVHTTHMSVHRDVVQARNAISLCQQLIS
jgi:hypothetical protein